jgi:hypothetical protein
MLAHLELSNSSNTNGAYARSGGRDTVDEVDGDEDGLGEDDLSREEEDDLSTEGGVKSEEGRSGESVKKKPRITLARGGACVACR